jgi:uncharacterized cupredoxin-like copper-binding protein
MTLAASTIAIAAMHSTAAAGPGAKGHAHGHGHGSMAFAAGEPGDPKKPNRIIEVIAREGDGKMSYSPDKIEVMVGEQIRFRIKNEGELAHEFLLDSFENNAKHKIQMEKNPEMEHDDPNGKRLESKKSGEVLWRFTKAGTFEFACLIPGHYEAGMKGVVVVSAESKSK